MLSSVLTRGFAKSQVSSLRPLWDFVLIDRFTTPATTISEIYIPESVKDKHNEGVVIATGPEKRDKDGNYEPLMLKRGDRVFLPDWSANEVKLDGKEYLLLREDDILGVLVGF
jgi:chaperonin GroES